MNDKPLYSQLYDLQQELFAASKGRSIPLPMMVDLVDSVVLRDSIRRYKELVDQYESSTMA